MLRADSTFPNCQPWPCLQQQGLQDLLSALRGLSAPPDRLHCLQAYYLQAPFAVERAPTLLVSGWPGAKGAPHLRVMQLTEYPVNGLVFESSVDMDAMADYVAGVCLRLQQANVPHNLFVADSGARVFLYPNAFAQAKAEVSLPGSDLHLHCLWCSLLHRPCKL